MEDLDRFAFQAEAQRLPFLILGPVFLHLILQWTNAGRGQGLSATASWETNLLKYTSPPSRAASCVTAFPPEKRISDQRANQSGRKRRAECAFS